MTLYQVGERFSRTVTYDRAIARELAMQLGDDNRLHHDDAFAATTRFGGPIVSGAVYGSMLMATMAQALCGRSDSVGLHFDIQFLQPVPEGSTVRLEWEIVAIEPKPRIGGEIVEMRGTVMVLGEMETLASTGLGRALAMPRDRMLGKPE